MSLENWEKFHELVLQTPSLQIPLRKIEDRFLFIDEVVSLGEKNGYLFSKDDVQEAFNNKNRQWIERWLKR